MSNKHQENDVDPAIESSRPSPEMAIAHEASEVISHMLGDGLSVIDPTTTIWTAGAAEELRVRVEENPILGTDLSQWEKLDKQLAGAPQEVVLLAAELVFLREHPLRSSLPTTRLAHVNQVLGHLDSPLTVPEQMSKLLARPAGTAGFDAGFSYNGALWLHLIWASTFIRYWNELSEAERETARTDPWALQQVMLDSGNDRADIRNTLQFLARPDTFEPIISVSRKKKIRDGLADRIGGSTGETPVAIDRDLFDIRGSLAQDIEGPFHFWTSGVAELWDGTANAETAGLDEPRPRHYWLYSPGAQASMWEEFSSNDIMGIGWDELDDLSQYPSREAIRQLLDTEGTGKSMNNGVLAVWQFQNEIAVGDIVYAKRGRKEIIGRGEVTSEARYDPERDSFRNVRSVNWTHVGSWDHPGNAALKTLTNITADNDYVEKLEGLFTDEEEPELTVPSTPLQYYDQAAFVNEVYLSEERYDRLSSRLTRQLNVIRAGPPGVVKTLAAKRLAYSIMGAKDPERVQMVQFHQSYSDEDFMMGSRPTETGGFELAEGPFYRFCEEARADDLDKPDRKS